MWRCILAWYILKQWIALKAHSDWILNSEYPVLFTSKQLAPEDIDIDQILWSLRNKWVNIIFCTISSRSFSVYKNNYSLQRRWLVVDIYLTTSQLSKYLPLVTLVNSCQLNTRDASNIRGRTSRQYIALLFNLSALSWSVKHPTRKSKGPDDRDKCHTPLYSTIEL